MNTIWQRLPSLICLLLLTTTIACGSEDNKLGPGDKGENQTANAGNEDNHDQIDDCDEGQRRNPFTGTCVDDDEDDTNPGTQCNPDEIYNPMTGVCETTTDPTECGQGEVYDPQSQSCVPEEQPACGLGAVLGQACTPSGETLAAAQVMITGIDCEGAAFSIQTSADGSGNYHLENVPAGDHEIFVTSGSFSGERTVRIREGQTTDLSSDDEKVCVSGEDVKIMVFNGSNEDMGALLDNMGLAYDKINSAGAATANFLEDLPRLMEYDILFFECNHNFATSVNAASDRERVLQNLRGFVNSGGSLYASDNAYQWINQTFPHLADFGGTATSEVVTADVMSTEMLTLLGKDTVEIDFDLSGMRVIDSIDPMARLHFRATRAGRPNLPLMYSYNDPSGGTVIYTSFHSSAQGGASSQDILDILHFLIFQL